jgi:hypothetical protein
MADRFLGVQAVVDGLTDPLLRVGFEGEPPGAAIDRMHARISQVGVERDPPSCSRPLCRA